MNRTVRLRFSMLAGAGLSAALITMLVLRHPEAVSSLGGTLASARPWGLAAVLATTLIHCAITAHKWRLLTEAGGSAIGVGRGFYLGYTTVIALAGQVMPQQVAIVVGRGMVLRMHAQIPVRRGALGALYDQGFDLMLPIWAIVPGGLVFLGLMGPGSAMALFSGCTAGFGVLLALLGAGLVDVMLAVAEKLFPPRMRAIPARLRAAAPRYLSRAFILRLYGWSLARFLNLVLRAWFVTWAIGIEVSPAALLFGHAGVSFAALLNFVPGSLGVAEWGWVSLLGLAGIQAGDAAGFAFSHRILVVAALLALSVFFALCMVALRRGARRGV